LVTLAGILLIASHVWAQTPARAPQPARTAQPPATPPAPAPAPAVAPVAPAAPVPPPLPPLREGQPINVRVELTITETGAGAPPVKKTVVAVVGDGYFGSVRGQAVSQSTTPGSLDRLVAPLNLDARPEILPSGKIRLTCTIQYQSTQRMTQERQINTDIKQNLVLNLESGKALVISEAADPIVTDRNVIVEVKATILK
jgi:hypothetical protein